MEYIEVNAHEAFLITNIIHEMFHCMDQGDYKRFGELFTTDAEIEVPKVKVKKQGTQEIEALCKFLHQKFSGCTHWEGNVVLKKKLSEHKTKSKEVYEICNSSYWKAVKGGEIVSIGRHLDVFVKTCDGNWLCKHRVIQHVWTKEDGHIEYAR